MKALIREIQRRLGPPGEILHLDLYEVRADEKVTLAVPIHLIGIPDGVRNFGGVLDHVLRELEIEVAAGRHPRARRARRHRSGHRPLDVRARPAGREGATILNDPDTPVCTVVAPRTEEAPAPVEEVAVPTEPELIRKPKADDEEEAEPKA